MRKDLEMGGMCSKRWLGIKEFMGVTLQKNVVAESEAGVHKKDFQNNDRRWEERMPT